MKKNKFIVTVILLLLVIGSMCFVISSKTKNGQFSSELISFVENNCDSTRECSVNLKDLTNFDWDNMFYVTEGNSLDHDYVDIKDYLPQTLTQERYTLLQAVDHGIGDHQVIFTKGNEIVYSEKLEAGIEGQIKDEIFFGRGISGSIKEYSAQDSLFRIERISTNNGGYLGNNDYFLSLNKVEK